MEEAPLKAEAWGERGDGEIWNYPTPCSRGAPMPWGKVLPPVGSVVSLEDGCWERVPAEQIPVAHRVQEGKAVAGPGMPKEQSPWLGWAGRGGAGG